MFFFSYWFTLASDASDNPLNFRKNLLERIWKLIMTTDDKIREEKLLYDINPIQDASFWGCSRMSGGGAGKKVPSLLLHLKSVTHILQW